MKRKQGSKKEKKEKRGRRRISIKFLLCLIEMIITIGDIEKKVTDKKLKVKYQH